MGKHYFVVAMLNSDVCRSIHHYLPAKTINQAGMFIKTVNVMEIAFPSIVLNT